jgi:cell division septal protein FtsQ
MKKLKIILSLGLVTAVAFSGIIFSGKWKDKSNPKTIELSGNTTLSKDEIFEFTRLNDSLLMSDTLNLQIIEERILKHPNINSVNVKRDGSNLLIEISEKEPFAIVISNVNPPLMLDDKLNLYTYKKENINLNLPVVSGFSNELDISSVSKEDYLKLKLAHFIISRMNAIDKILFNYISEIHYGDSASITLYTLEDAVPVYLVDYSSLSPELLRLNYYQYFNVNNETLRSLISERLARLYNFVKQVMLYRTKSSIEYVDLRFKDMVVVKNKN